MKEIVIEKCIDNLINIYDVYGDDNLEIYVSIIFGKSHNIFWV